MNSLDQVIDNFASSINQILSERGDIGRINRRERIQQALNYGSPVTAPIATPNLIPQAGRMQSGSPVGAEQALQDFAVFASRLPSGDPNKNVAPPDWGSIYNNRAQLQQAEYAQGDKTAIAEADMINQRLGQQESQVNQGRQAMASQAIDAVQGEAQLAEEQARTGISAQSNEIQFAELLQKRAEGGDKATEALLKSINDYVPNPEYRVRVAAQAMTTAQENGLIENGQYVGSLDQIPAIAKSAAETVLGGRSGGPQETPPASDQVIDSLQPSGPQPSGVETFPDSTPATESAISGVNWSSLADPTTAPETFGPTQTNEFGQQFRQSNRGSREFDPPAPITHSGKQEVLPDGTVIERDSRGRPLVLRRGGLKTEQEVDQAERTAESEGAVRVAVKELPKQSEKAENADNQISLVDASLAAVSKGALTSAPGRLWGSMAQYFDDLGIGGVISDKARAEFEKTGVLDANITTLAIGKLKEIGGSDTEKELEESKKAFRGNNQKEGIMHLLKAYRIVQVKIIRRYNEMLSKSGTIGKTYKPIKSRRPLYTINPKTGEKIYLE